MEHFTIHCTTCKAKLIVKDESVIGDILACPKCQSMVQVVPPTDWQKPGSPSSPGETAVATETPAPPPQQPAPSTASRNTAPAPAKATAVVPPALPNTQPPAPQPQAPETTVETPAASTPAPPPPPPEEPAAAEAAEPGPSLVAGLMAAASRNWTLLAGLLGGVALGGVVWLAIALMAPAPPVVADTTSPAVDSTTAATLDEASTPQADPATETPDVPAAREQPPRSPAATEPSPARSPTEEPPSAPKPSAPQLAAVDAPAPTEATAPDTEAVEETPPAPGPALKLDPVPASGMPPAGSSDDTGSVPATSSDNPPDAELPPLDELPTDDPPAKATPLPKDQVIARLNVRLPSFAFDGVPLAQFAGFMGDLTGVPVVLDEKALAVRGKHRRTPVSVKLQNATAGAALAAAAKSAGLAVTFVDGQIVITAR